MILHSDPSYSYASIRSSSKVVLVRVGAHRNANGIGKPDMHMPDLDKVRIRKRAPRTDKSYRGKREENNRQHRVHA